MPTYEPRRDHLRAAVASVLAQTETRWTLVIHDDASEGDVRAMIEDLLVDPRITFIRSPKRLGIGGNWNATLARATNAPFVQFLFQDDSWEPTYLVRAVTVMEHHAKVGMVVAEHDYAFEDESDARALYDELMELRRSQIAPGKHDGTAFLRYWIRRGLSPNIIGEPSFVLLRRSLVSQVGPFAEDMPQFLDAEYWTRALPQTTWYFLPEKLGTFRVHSGGASARHRREGLGLFDRLRTLQQLTATAPSRLERVEAKRAMQRELQPMVAKFLKRRASGEAVRGQGSSVALRFAIRHPFLVMGALVRELRSEKNK